MRSGSEKGTKNKGRSPGRRAVPGGVPSADLSGLELDTRRATRVATAADLRNGRTPLTVIAVTDRAATLADDALHQAMTTQPPPPLACREGCDWCCYLPVGTAAAEVFRIRAYLRQSLSPDEFAALRDRVSRLDAHKRSLTPAQRRDARLPCPLLVEHRCLAYAVRPLTCRGFNSQDARRCEQSLQPGRKVEVPMYGPQLRLAAFVLDGLLAGLTEAGLYGERLELIAALRIALEVPDAEAQWLAGAALFAPARMG